MQFVPQRGLLAVAAVLDIALNAAKRPMPAKTLAGRYGLTPRYLEPMLQALVHGGVLKGVRGPQGGYQLGRPSTALTVAEIVRTAAVSTSAGFPPIKSQPLVASIVLPGLETAERAILEALQAVTVETLLRRASAQGLTKTEDRPVSAPAD
jgi:Rrf2 family protein